MSSEVVSEAASGPVSERGREARARIMRAALEAFGDDGFDGATTRQIADAAGVSLPAIKYYFENKEGLYLACAREIVDRYRSGAGEFLASVVDALRGELDPDTARRLLKQIMHAVTEISGDDEDAQLRTAFVLRELTEQGPAFEMLYRDLWRPGVRLTSELVARIEGKARPDRESHVEALMLHASLTAFSTTRPVSLRYLDDLDPTTPDDLTEHSLSVVESQIDRLGRTNAAR